MGAFACRCAGLLEANHEVSLRRPASIGAVYHRPTASAGLEAKSRRSHEPARTTTIDAHELSAVTPGIIWRLRRSRRVSIRRVARASGEPPQEQAGHSENAASPTKSARPCRRRAPFHADPRPANLSVSPVRTDSCRESVRRPECTGWCKRPRARTPRSRGSRAGRYVIVRAWTIPTM